jgi:hypothetical protein
MEIEAAVLVADQDAEEPLRDALSRREAPLAVRGRPGPEKLALGAEKNGRDGVVEAGDGQGEEEAEEKKRRNAKREEDPAL